MIYRSFSTRRGNPFLFLLLTVLFFIAAIWLLKGAFRLLSIASPFLLIAAVLFNYRVVWGYLVWLKDTLFRNPIMGIFAIGATIIAFPVVAGYLFFKALYTPKTKPVHEPNFIPYEELDDDFLDLSDLKHKNQEIQEQFKRLK